MPHNKKGDHYANPAYGRMMEAGAGGSKGDKMMGAYGEKAAEYMKMGYMINKLEIEYAENGFVVKCYWEYPKGHAKKAGSPMEMSYMEPTVKVFTKLSDLTHFVDYAFNDMRHGYSGAYPHTKTNKAKSSTTSRKGGGRRQSNYPAMATGNPGSHNY